jgi:hypothetical protein
MLSRHAPPRAEELHWQADAPPTMGELAETLVLDRSALGHNLRPLEHDGPVVAGDMTGEGAAWSSPQGDAPSLGRSASLDQ